MGKPTKEQMIKQRKMAKYRLKHLIRKARVNAFWLKELDDLTIGENVHKNITIVLNRPKQKRGVLTIHDKKILNRPAKNRTNDERIHLKKLFNELPCFDTISPFLQDKLIDVVEFQYFEKDRLLLLEGHPATAMYFMISGEVLLSKLMFDTELKKKVSKPLKLLSGEYFGHIGLVYDAQRNATIISKTEVELLCVYKEDFDNILKEVMEAKHENIKNAIKRFDYFKNFTDDKIEECCIIARIEQFAPQETVYSQNDIRNFSYFVLSGSCMIMQCLKIRDKGKGKCELVEAEKKLSPLELAMMAKLPPRPTGIASMIDTKSKDVKNQFIDVGTYNCGGVFGIHENMENRVIIARNLVQCLMIPRYWLFQKAQNIGNVWQRIKLFLNSSVPSQEKLFEKYLENQKWKKYKKKTIDEIKRENGIEASTTKYYNIPVICRIENL